MAHCFPFFEEMIEAQGEQIPGTNFYFMDNMNGRISYTGKLHYPHAFESSGVSVFIELNSDLLFEGIGFPELLIDKSISQPENYNKFDYAKYYGGELTDKQGEYNYNFHVDSYIFSDEEYVYNKWDGLEHLIYHTRNDNYVIVSRDVFTIIDYLISFPYLFVFYFLSVLVLLFIGNQNIRNRRIMFDLKFKIQAAIISIVFISLLLVALATIFYNVNEYKLKHQNDLNEKMKSIAEEIDMRLEDVSEITIELEDWLHRELAKLSNIFRTDINIYGTDGNLIASSRAEIFMRGLVSTRINAQAYYEIFHNFQINYFQPEKIGELSYLSAYRPIINNRGDYLGFINLPYFIKQDNYRQEISTFIVAFINLYVLLFLASIIIAIFIANQITRPLVVIQENLQKMQLGKHNEPIHYSRKDEIGSLVKEYNKKVDELAVSADLLARSERESAWREMAKQIAHEIKNPLTPMKLNIQYLQRAKLEGKEYNKYIKRVTATLIEQIDNLSDIATEFSNFAKIPTARNQVFNLASQVQKLIDLFETHDRAEIIFDVNSFENIEVNADREQLSRAIINLIKNGIQAIPENEIGIIKITLNRREHMAVIAVSDNGTGIPVELRDKLFSPSFTTKTSGMGLGLAIVKNIVENFSGKIWFETELGKGSIFFLEIPVYIETEIQ
ncbi:MAG: GHKL domain-containing protein, partial [Prolixibacteraceae bacterium]|nr:GHKL domain-containing protein [Prolixibacteraceae bacterium]